MKRTFIALLAFISLAQASGLQAQEAADTTKVSPEAPSTQQTVVFVADKSPFTAGILSAAVFPGLGSFYAGNKGHGIVHLAIGAVSTVGVRVGADDCNLVFSSPDDNCTLLGVSLGVFVVNWIWSITTGVSDAKEYNRSLREKGLQVAPELVAIRSDGQTSVGLQLVRFGI